MALTLADLRKFGNRGYLQQATGILAGRQGDEIANLQTVR